MLCLVAIVTPLSRLECPLIRFQMLRKAIFTMSCAFHGLYIVVVRDSSEHRSLSLRKDIKQQHPVQRVVNIHVQM